MNQAHFKEVGSGIYYITQEAAMAPGIADEWPNVIPHPTNKNGRLVKRTAADFDFSDHEGVNAGFFVAAMRSLERAHKAPAGQQRMCDHIIEELTYHLAKAEAAFKRCPLEPRKAK